MSYTPQINIYNQGTVQCGCGSGRTVTDCGCSAQGQSAYPIQSLPAPTLPCDPMSGVPADYTTTDAVLWPGPDIPSKGIKKGDSLTKVVNIIIQALG